MTTTETPNEALIPYQFPMPPDALKEIHIGQAGDVDDERLWVPRGEGVSSRPLCFSASGGYYATLLRAKRSGIITRHRHPGMVHGYVIEGSWHYLEHPWVAREGSYIFEPPGETHTLVVPEGVEEMLTFFYVQGGLIQVDPYGKALGYEDVFTRIEDARKHYKAVGLGADYVQQFIR